MYARACDVIMDLNKRRARGPAEIGPHVPPGRSVERTISGVRQSAGGRRDSSDVTVHHPPCAPSPPRRAVFCTGSPKIDRIRRERYPCGTSPVAVSATRDEFPANYRVNTSGHLPRGYGIIIDFRYGRCRATFRNYTVITDPVWHERRRILSVHGSIYIYIYSRSANENV